MRYRDYVWRPSQPLYPNAHRNEPCPCGSGKKFKNCCDGKLKSDFRPGVLGLILLLVFLAAVVLMFVGR